MYYALAPSPIPCSPGLADGLPQAPLRAARPLRCGRPFPQALCRRPPRRPPPLSPFPPSSMPGPSMGSPVLVVRAIAPPRRFAAELYGELHWLIFW